jgi:hypothetical protein
LNLDYQNGEGYPDPTAAEALANIQKVKNKRFAHSGLSSTSAHPIPVMWKEM